MEAETAALDWAGPFAAEDGPIYLQIAAAIEAAAMRGALRPGDRLPSQRALATHLGVDMTTVTRAYAEARARGVLDAMTGRGSFVAAPPLRSGPEIDLSMNIPPPPFGLRLGELMQRGIAEILQRADVDTLMSYHAGPGTLADRSAAASWLEPTLSRVAPERIVVTAGAQAAVAALLAALMPPGAALLTDPLTYPGLLRAAADRKLRLIAVPGDGDGMLPAALREMAAESGARHAYLMPVMHNPTATTMPTVRREALAEAAAATDLTLIEDDPYGLLASHRQPALAALAPERTYHIATLSKGLTPGLRIAYVVAPEGQSTAPLERALRALVLMPAPLMVALTTNWIRTGTAGDLLAGVRREAAARQVIAREALPLAVGHPDGLHLWLPLPAHWNRHRLTASAERQGLGLTQADAFKVGKGDPPDAVRVSLGAVPDRGRLTRALQGLASLIDAGADETGPLV